MDKNILKVKEGDVPSASKYNDLVDLAASPPIIAGSGLEISNYGNGCNIACTLTVPVTWTGKVIGGGGGSYGYLVQRQFASNSSGTITYADETGSDNPRNMVVTVINKAELSGGIITIPLGMIINVTEEPNGHSPPVTAYTTEFWIPRASAIYQVLMSVDDLSVPALAMRYMCFHS